MSSRCALSLALALSFCMVRTAAAVENRGSIGTKVDSLSLADFRGKKHSLSDFADKQAIVVAFLGNECPLCKQYGPRLEELARRNSADRGVAFLGVNSNQQDAPTEIAAYARHHEIEFPLLKDPGNAVADPVAAERTPEVFLLDNDRIVRYRGRIDDQFGLSGTGYAKPKITRRDLAVAIDELLAGNAVSQTVTETPGCLIGRVATVEPHGEVTYSNQIARSSREALRRVSSAGRSRPLRAAELRRGCRLGRDDVGSHQRSADAPLVRQSRLRPFHERRQTHGTKSKDLFRQWVRNGCPQGDPKDLPSRANL